ncbi:unnamed protein product [Calicophoron daubneyi]|uniref:Uncharacterized protein n=1 Tax=Calicophoron daubneyi TaxID=300641 RepID=A0AAV2SYW3_CALDB
MDVAVNTIDQESDTQCTNCALLSTQLRDYIRLYGRLTQLPTEDASTVVDEKSGAVLFDKSEPPSQLESACDYDQGSARITCSTDCNNSACWIQFNSSEICTDRPNNMDCGSTAGSPLTGHSGVFISETNEEPPCTPESLNTRDNSFSQRFVCRSSTRSVPYHRSDHICKEYPLHPSDEFKQKSGTCGQLGAQVAMLKNRLGRTNSRLLALHAVSQQWKLRAIRAETTIKKNGAKMQPVSVLRRSTLPSYPCGVLNQKLIQLNRQNASLKAKLQRVRLQLGIKNRDCHSPVDQLLDSTNVSAEHPVEQSDDEEQQSQSEAGDKPSPTSETERSKEKGSCGKLGLPSTSVLLEQRNRALVRQLQAAKSAKAVAEHQAVELAHQYRTLSEMLHNKHHKEQRLQRITEHLITCMLKLDKLISSVDDTEAEETGTKEPPSIQSSDKNDNKTAFRFKETSRIMSWTEIYEFSHALGLRLQNVLSSRNTNVSSLVKKIQTLSEQEERRKELIQQLRDFIRSSKARQEETQLQLSALNAELETSRAMENRLKCEARSQRVQLKALINEKHQLASKLESMTEAHSKCNAQLGELQGRLVDWGVQAFTRTKTPSKSDENSDLIKSQIDRLFKIIQYTTRRLSNTVLRIIEDMKVILAGQTEPPCTQSYEVGREIKELQKVVSTESLTLARATASQLLGLSVDQLDRLTFMDASNSLDPDCVATPSTTFPPTKRTTFDQKSLYQKLSRLKQDALGWTKIWPTLLREDCSFTRDKTECDHIIDGINKIIKLWGEITRNSA